MRAGGLELDGEGGPCVLECDPSVGVGRGRPWLSCEPRIGQPGINKGV